MTNCILKLILPLFHESSYLFHSEPNLAVDRCLHSCTLSPCRKKQDTPWTLPKESPVFHKHPTVYIMYVYIYICLLCLYVCIYIIHENIYIHTHNSWFPTLFPHVVGWPKFPLPTAMSGALRESPLTFQGNRPEVSGPPNYRIHQSFCWWQPEIR